MCGLIDCLSCLVFMVVTVVEPPIFDWSGNWECRKARGLSVWCSFLKDEILIYYPKLHKHDIQLKSNDYEVV